MLTGYILRVQLVEIDEVEETTILSIDTDKNVTSTLPNLIGVARAVVTFARGRMRPK